MLFHKEMFFTKELCEASTLGEVCEIATRCCAVPWGLRNTFGPRTEEDPFPAKMFQTYYHDTTAGPKDAHKSYLWMFEREFYDDELLLNTVAGHAGEFGTTLLSKLSSPAHQADVFATFDITSKEDSMLTSSVPFRSAFIHCSSGFAESGALRKTAGGTGAPPGSCQ